MSAYRLCVKAASALQFSCSDTQILKELESQTLLFTSVHSGFMLNPPERKTLRRRRHTCCRSADPATTGRSINPDPSTTGWSSNHRPIHRPLSDSSTLILRPPADPLTTAQSIDHRPIHSRWSFDHHPIHRPSADPLTTSRSFDHGPIHLSEIYFED